MSDQQPDSRHYPPHPIPAIGVVVWKGDGVLLIQRGKAPRKGAWGLPGGAQEVGETHFEAAIREVREEAGITIKPFAIITAIDSITRDAAGRAEYHYSIVEVNAEYIEGELQPASDAADARWVSVEELPHLHLWSEVTRIVKLAKAQRENLASLRGGL